MIKRYSKHITLLTVLFTVLAMSCRKEEMELIQEQDDTVEANSAIASILLQTATNDGSDDNILDRANCISIKYPVTLTVNDTPLVVNTIDDLYTVEAIFDDEDEDDDILVIDYPITVELSDYSEVIVNSSQELTALSTNCLGENVTDEDIECLDFQYPISASVFNTNNELIETISIANDSQLYNFTETIELADIVVLNFPITVQLQDATQITLNTLSELQATINTYESSCDEDDDFDFEDDDCDTCTTDQLKDALVNCDDWIVKDLERNAINYDDFYDNYVFNFFEDNTVVSVWGSNSASGTWTASGTGNNITVIIDIPGLDLCNNNWMLHEIQDYDEETKVDLRLNGVDRLRYEKNCDSDTSSTLEATLTDGLWVVDTYLDDGIDQTSDYSGYQLNFLQNGTVIADNGTPINGTWVAQNFDTILALDFDTSFPFNEFNDDWDVLSISSSQIIIQDISGGGGGTDTLTLEKL